MAGLAQPAHRLDPTEDLLYPFALALTEFVARIARGALVNDAGGLAGEMRGHLMFAHFLYQLFAVVALVTTQRDPMPAWNLLHQRHCRLRFSAAGGLGDAAVDRQAMAILHQHVARVAQLGFLARPLTRQACLGISGGLVGVVAAPLAVKVHAGIARVVVPRRGLVRCASFALETLLPGPRLNQRAVDREVLVREQAPPVGLPQHRREKGLSNLALEQPVTIFGENRHVPYRVIDAQPHEPAEQEIVVELF